MSRIAIVIGVNKPKTLPPLQGAVADALKFAAWIRTQGFPETKIFTDDQGPVRFSDIFDELDRVVGAATYSQAVIYFAGHGFQNGGSEVWLLSGAPTNPSEAISVEASVMAARESGLLSIVFISDACRSIPSGMQNNRVDGGSVFPNVSLNRATRPEVDRLFATLPSLVAVEAAQADDKARREGVFTREFMRSYVDPPANVIARVQENGETVEVVTNRKLKEIVRELVEDAVFTQSPNAAQLPEFILESVEAYVGRVTHAPVNEIALSLPKATNFSLGKEARINGDETEHGPPRPVPSPPRRRPTRPSVAALAKRAIETAGAGQGIQAAATAASGIDASLGFSQSLDLFSQRGPVERFESETGFSITGSNAVEAICGHSPPDVLSGEVIRLWFQGNARAASVLIVLDNGNGTVLPALRGYIGHIFVEHGVVANVNYVPAQNSWRWNDYVQQQTRVEALRATVAAAARLGVFRIDSTEAKSFADQIRILKSIDPTLGLYAAYAYASAGLQDDVASVRRFMHEDLRSDLFDVAMLAQRNVSPIEAGGRVVPFCPMLRQGWSLLSVREARLNDAAHQARDWLLPALWTTFSPEGVALLKNAVERGDFK